MPRPKALIDEQPFTQTETVLATIKDAKLVIQLKALLPARGHSIEAVARILWVSRRSIFRWIHQLQVGGVEPAGSPEGAPAGQAG